MKALDDAKLNLATVNVLLRYLSQEAVEFSLETEDGYRVSLQSRVQKAYQACNSLVVALSELDEMADAIQKKTESRGE